MGASSFKVSFNLDEDYRPPKAIRGQVLGALAYFANPDDLILDEMRKKLRADVVARKTKDAAKGKVGF